MRLELSYEQLAFLEEFKEFADQKVSPLAAEHDREGRVGPEIVGLLGQGGYLAPTLPRIYGGRDLDLPSYVLLHEQIGRACASLRSLLTVQDMVVHVLFRFGSEDQRRRLLPALASGSLLASFALTEPDAGSEISATSAVARRTRGDWSISGHKTWISFGLLADVFLVFARADEGITAFLIKRDAKGLAIRPSPEVIGLRGSMLAELTFDDCFVSDNDRIGPVGRGHPHITTAALTLGRLGVAAGCVGILQACSDASCSYARSKLRGGTRLRNHQLIAEKLANIYIGVDAARLLCLQAAVLLQENDPRAFVEVAIAKQFAASAAMQAAANAVQIHGAIGCSPHYAVERHYRDAKVMEIIEGTSELQLLVIGEHGYAEMPSFVR